MVKQRRTPEDRRKLPVRVIDRKIEKGVSSKPMKLLHLIAVLLGAMMAGPFCTSRRDVYVAPHANRHDWKAARFAIVFEARHKQVGPRREYSGTSYTTSPAPDTVSPTGFGYTTLNWYAPDGRQTGEFRSRSGKEPYGGVYTLGAAFHNLPRTNNVWADSERDFSIFDKRYWKDTAHFDSLVSANLISLPVVNNRKGIWCTGIFWCRGEDHQRAKAKRSEPTFTNLLYFSKDSSPLPLLRAVKGGLRQGMLAPGETPVSGFGERPRHPGAFDHGREHRQFPRISYRGRRAEGRRRSRDSVRRQARCRSSIELQPGPRSDREGPDNRGMDGFDCAYGRGAPGHATCRFGADGSWGRSALAAVALPNAIHVGACRQADRGMDATTR